MRTRLLYSLCAAVVLTGTMQAQIGRNCPGEHPNLLRDKSGQLKSFTPEQLGKMAIERVLPVMPPMPNGVRYDSYVTLRILVDHEGEVACIWGNAGNPIFFAAADEAGRWWKFKRMVVNGKPMEFTGTLRFHLVTGH